VSRIEPLPPYDVAVVGAGIVGLATAWQLLQRRPGLSVCVLEQAPEVGTGQSGHNSGVVHAGLYYRPGSLKGELCRRGRAQLREFCDEHGLPYDERGKLVVATTTDEFDRLPGLRDTAHANGVRDAEVISASAMRDLEPHVRGLGALWSPSTAIVDFPAVCRRLAESIVAAGSEVRLNAPVVGIERDVDDITVRVEAGLPSVRARRVVLCTGLYADRTAVAAGGSQWPVIVPFRGEYHALSPRAAALSSRLIYPVPDPRYPFLGVHVTPMTSGRTFVGPNAVLALAREGYQRRTVEERQLRELAASKELRSFSRTHWRTGAFEVARSLSKRLYARSVRRYLPDVRVADLLPAPAGVRAQAMRANGQLEDDFAIEEFDGIVAVRNAPSPAATSSLAIGEHLAELVLR